MKACESSKNTTSQGHTHKRQRIDKKVALPEGVVPLPILGADVVGWTSQEIAALDANSSILSVLGDGILIRTRIKLKI